MADIEIIDANKHFGANHVIRNLNLQIRHRSCNHCCLQ